MQSCAVVDAGPLAAAIYRGDRHHEWSVRALREPRIRFITCEAAITEAQYILENNRLAVEALGKLCERMEVVAIGRERLRSVFRLALEFTPKMDFADACAVVLVRGISNAFVLTTDFRDFSTYRVPFASPEGMFHE